MHRPSTTARPRCGNSDARSMSAWPCWQHRRPQRTGIQPGATSTCGVGGTCTLYVALAIFRNRTPLLYPEHAHGRLLLARGHKGDEDSLPLQREVWPHDTVYWLRDIQAGCLFYSNVLEVRNIFENGKPVGFMVLKRDDGRLF